MDKKTGQFELREYLEFKQLDSNKTLKLFIIYIVGLFVVAILFIIIYYGFVYEPFTCLKDKILLQLI